MKGTVRVPGYRIVRPLASGASGTVYLAVQEALDREVALKVLAPGLFGVEETRARFLREAKVQAQLAHPNLLRVMDAGFAGQHPYLAVELIDGGSLGDLLSRHGPRELAAAVSLARAIGSGLSHAHEREIVHRDLKPENVLLTAAGEVKVADFGLAKALSDREAVQTASGVILGTPGYMAPEVLSGEVATPAADVYALGVILYEMIAGRKPFEASDFGKLLRVQLRNEPVPLGQLDSRIPAGLDALLLDCLAVEGTKRPTAAAATGRLTRLEPMLAKLLTPAVRSGTGRAAHAGGSSHGQVDAAATVQRTQEPRRTSAVPSRLASSEATVCAPGSGHRPPFARSRLAMLFGAALAVLAVAWWAAVAMRGPVPAGSATSGTGARGPGDRERHSNELPRLPDADQVAVSTDRVRVRLSHPLSQPATATCAGPDGKAPRTVELAAGDRLFVVPGLAPGARYTLGLRVGSVAWHRQVETLASTPAGFALLNRRAEYAKGLAVAAAGPSLVALWKQASPRYGSFILARTSPDAGVTWGPAEQLTPELGEIGWPTVEHCREGFVATWGAGSDRASSRAEVWFRPDTGGRWRPVASVPSVAHEPGLALPGGTTVEFLTWQQATPEAIPGIRWTSFDRAAGRLVSAANPWPLPHAHWGIRCCQLRRLGPTLLCVFVHQAETGGMKALAEGPFGGRLAGAQSVRILSSTEPRAGKWSAERPVTPPFENVVDTPDVAIVGGQLAIGYQASGRLRVVLVPDALHPPSEPVEPLGPGRRPFVSSLIADSGRLYLACLASDQSQGKSAAGAKRSLDLLSSQDGKQWTLVSRRLGLNVDLAALRLTRCGGSFVCLGVTVDQDVVVLN
ncbi:MAG: serine/threonine protein kinase [Candidatus Riflebacteria bacterium]|nr:serine/threonine protein kinase [Candidatus Riflebacteria bacterium]